jgi:hypothetical protein
MNQKLLREGKYTDLAIVFYLAKKFITPFKKWKSFDLGIIDEKGKILKKKLTTKEEKNSFTSLDRFILKIRTIVGDHLFLKIGLTALLLADHKPEGKVIHETGGTDMTFLRKLKEEVLEDITSINIPMAGRDEYINMDFEKSNGYINFGVSVFVGSDMVSTVGGNFLPINDTNIEFFRKLNDIFSNLRYGDNENLFLSVGDIDITVNVNYGENEIKMTQDTEGDDVHADFFIIFNGEKERNEFLSGWAKFYSDVAISLDI